MGNLITLCCLTNKIIYVIITYKNKIMYFELSLIILELFNFRKYRLVKPVTGLDVHNKIRDFKLEEQNMFYLRHPYLTPVS